MRLADGVFSRAKAESACARALFYGVFFERRRGGSDQRLRGIVRPLGASAPTGRDVYMARWRVRHRGGLAADQQWPFPDRTEKWAWENEGVLCEPDLPPLEVPRTRRLGPLRYPALHHFPLGWRLKRPTTSSEAA